MKFFQEYQKIMDMLYIPCFDIKLNHSEIFKIILFFSSYKTEFLIERISTFIYKAFRKKDGELITHVVKEIVHEK